MGSDGGPWGGGLFIMSEVPLYSKPNGPIPSPYIREGKVQLPAKTTVESGTSQSKSGTSVESIYDGNLLTVGVFSGKKFND